MNMDILIFYILNGVLVVIFPLFTLFSNFDTLNLLQNLVFNSFKQINVNKLLTSFEDSSLNVKVKQSLYTPWRRLGGEEI
jgi:hypothetical protein